MDFALKQEQRLVEHDSNKICDHFCFKVFTVSSRSYDLPKTNINGRCFCGKRGFLLAYLDALNMNRRASVRTLVEEAYESCCKSSDMGQIIKQLALCIAQLKVNLKRYIFCSSKVGESEWTRAEDSAFAVLSCDHKISVTLVSEITLDSLQVRSYSPKSSDSARHCCIVRTRRGRYHGYYVKGFENVNLDTSINPLLRDIVLPHNESSKINFVRKVATSVHISANVPPFIDFFLNGCQITEEFYPLETIYDKYKNVVKPLIDEKDYALLQIVNNSLNFAKYLAHMVQTATAATVLHHHSSSVSAVVQQIQRKFYPSRYNLVWKRSARCRQICAMNSSKSTDPQFNVNLYFAAKHGVVGRSPESSLPQKIVDPIGRTWFSKAKGHCGVATEDIWRGRIICEYLGMLVDKEEFEKNRQPIYIKSPFMYPLAEYDNVGKKNQVWDAYMVIGDGCRKSITIEENKGAWINSVINSETPNDNSLYVNLNVRPANCKIKKVLFNNSTKLYAVATANIPRSYEIIQNYHNDLLIEDGN